MRLRVRDISSKLDMYMKMGIVCRSRGTDQTTGSTRIRFQSLTQDSRDFSHERNVQEKLVFDMSPKLVSKIEASGGSQNCTLESSFAAVQFAHDSSSRIVIYRLKEGHMARLDISDSFKKIFGEGGEIRTFFAPGRVNLIGDHTDYNGGHLLSAALTFGVYAAVRLRDDRTVRLASLNWEKGEIHSFSLDDEMVFRDELDGWTGPAKGVLRAFMKEGLVPETGFDALYFGDLISGAGLASTTAAEVVSALYLRALYGFTHVDDMQTAVLVRQAETEYIGRMCGIADPFTSLVGKKDCAVLLVAERMRCETIPLRLGDTELVLTNSGIRQPAANAEYAERRRECEKALKRLLSVCNIRMLGDLSQDTFNSCKDVIMNDTYIKRARHAVTENARAIRAVSALRVGNLQRFGEFMKQSHISLRDDYEVSCPELDFLAEEACRIPGVLGSRMMGGGFGGCTVTLLKKEADTEFKERLRASYKEKFGMEAAFYTVHAGDGAHEVTDE